MKRAVEMRLVHDGRRWVASSGSIVAGGRTLAELDGALDRELRQNGEFPPGAELEIRMRYDFDGFPPWLRQYHSHYFNRRIRLRL